MEQSQTPDRGVSHLPFSCRTTLEGEDFHPKLRKLNGIYSDQKLKANFSIIQNQPDSRLILRPEGNLQQTAFPAGGAFLTQCKQLCRSAAKQGITLVPKRHSAK
jgi:hypothetical protein